ncbi:hypothetical protein LTR24_002424 [Lithohypha guttulata]|nr:hypothetical protein LTR24_002424 [Lithohypha guttulata]
MSVALDNSSLLESTTAPTYAPYKPAWLIGDTRAPMPKWYLPAYFAALVFSLALSRRHRITYSLPIVVALIAMLPFHTEGSFKKDFDLGNLVLGWFFFYLGLCFGAPERMFWKNDGKSLTPDEREVDIRSKSLGERLQWSWAIWSNPRGLGWSHQAPGIKPVREGKWTFVAKKFMNWLLLSVAYDVLHLWYKHLMTTNMAPTWSIYHYPLYLQILIGVSNQFRIYCEIVSMHSLAAGITVGLGIYKPAEWPPLVGSFADAYRVSRFWGLVWHQLMRQVADGGGSLMAMVIPFPKRSALGSLMYLVGAFATTGLYHNIVNIFATGFRAGLHPCGDMAFVQQAFAIFVERYAVDLVKKSGHASNVTGWKIFGYIWTAAAIGFTEIGWVEGLTRAGIWNVDLKVLGYVGFSM